MDFNEIIANIERELAELKRINETLIKENTLLKNGMSISSLSIEYVFYRAIDSGKKGQARNYAYRALINYGCVFLTDINEKNLVEMYKAKKIRIASLGFIVAVLKHYSINIEIPCHVLSINRDSLEYSIRSTEYIVKFYQ